MDAVLDVERTELWVTFNMSSAVRRESDRAIYSLQNYKLVALHNLIDQDRQMCHSQESNGS